MERTDEGKNIEGLVGGQWHDTGEHHKEVELDADLIIDSIMKSIKTAVLLINKANNR